MHRSTDIEVEKMAEPAASVTWNDVLSTDEWLDRQPVEQWKKQFDEKGFLVIESLIGNKELSAYEEIYNRMLSGEIDTSAHRHDLGNTSEQKTEHENICQIMWPSVYVRGLNEGPIHQRGLAIAKILLGDDTAIDFDMLLAKMPFTGTETPWHQDESYWLDMPDKRAASCWVAIDESFQENGCMWFGKNKVLSVLPHRPVREGCHVLTCNGSEEDGVPVPLKPGGATFHHGLTLHYSRGNSVDKKRRAYVVNYRPKSMVDYERQRGFDHGKQGVTGVIGKGKTHLKNTSSS